MGTADGKISGFLFLRYLFLKACHQISDFCVKLTNEKEKVHFIGFVFHQVIPALDMYRKTESRKSSNPYAHIHRTIHLCSSAMIDQSPKNPN